MFQPGLFTNYLAQPHRTTNHLDTIETPFDFDNRRMIVCDGGDDQKVTMTTVTDFANVVAMAVEYSGDWPVVGGIKGSDLSLKDLVTLGEQLRGMSTPIARISRDPATCALTLPRRTFRCQQSQRRPVAPGRLQ